MVLDLDARSGLKKSTNGMNMERSDNTMLETLLPRILEAVGSGYNHVEGRINDVQNKRLPSLEAQIRSFDQSQAQTKETISQLSDLKQRLDAAEAKGAANETISQDLSSTVKKLEAKATSTGTDASRVKALAQRLEKLEADRLADRNKAEGFKASQSGGVSDGPSLESVLENVQKLSDTVQKFQGEKEADARKIQSLTETVKKLQSDRAADRDRLQTNSDHLKKLESEQHKAQKDETSKLDDISDELEKLKADRASDASRVQATSESLNKLRSQQAEKANRTSLTVVSEKINKLQAEEKARQSGFEVVRKQNWKLEDRMDGIEKQYKYLDDQSRKTETFHSDIASVAATAQGIQSRVDKLERRDTGAAAANQTTLSLFKRVEKLEGRDAGVARVNAEAQTLLKRVDKMSGACADIERVGANTQALVTRIQKLEGHDFNVRVERLEKKSPDIVDLTAAIKTLREWIEKLEKCEKDRVQLDSAPASSIARTLLQRLNQGEKFDDETKSLIKMATSKDSIQKMQKNPSDRAIDAFSVSSSDLGLAKESIEKSSPFSGGQKPPSRTAKPPQVHLAKPSHNRSSEQRLSSGLPESKKTTSKRTFDMSNQDNEDELAMPSRKRSRSEAARGRILKASNDRPELFPKRQAPRDRNAVSSPVAPARVASRRKEAAQVAGASNEESSEEDEEDSDVAPRRTSRTVKPTERGSHLPFLDTTARRNP